MYFFFYFYSVVQEGKDNGNGCVIADVVAVVKGFCCAE
jgi:hypothetical protein